MDRLAQSGRADGGWREDGWLELVISQLFSLSKGIQALEASSSPTLKWNF